MVAGQSDGMMSLTRIVIEQHTTYSQPGERSNFQSKSTVFTGYVWLSNHCRDLRNRKPTDLGGEPSVTIFFENHVVSGYEMYVWKMAESTGGP